MKPKLILCLALVLSGGLFGCSTAKQNSANWPVFYDSEKGPAHLSISRLSKTLATYTNEIPDWNYDLRNPAAKINSAEIKYLGELGGLRTVEARLALADPYYTDTLMILEEVEPGRFLPVYVQDYNRDTRSPSTNYVVLEKGKIIIYAGMDYEGTGGFHNRYKIIISPRHDPVLVASFY